MIYGIGVDCTQIDRMEKSLAKAAFIERVFSPEERDLINGKKGGNALQTAAACFAAKEAFLKACGLGLGGFGFEEVAALRKESGAPYYKLSGKAAAFCREKGLVAHLSITHEAGLAIAFAVLEK